MAKPVNKYMGEIVSKFQSGAFGICQLAKMYNVDKATISRYIKKNKIKPCVSNIEINATFSQHEVDFIKKLVTIPKNAQSKQVGGVKSSDDDLRVSVESIESLRRPDLKRALENVGEIILSRCIEILQNEALDSKELGNIARACDIVNNMLNIIPKSPTFAQQININEAEKKENKKIDLEIKFI